MNRYLIPILLFFSFNCMAQQNKSNCIKPALDGHWKFVSTTTVEDSPFLNNYPTLPIVAKEALPPEPAPYLIFEDDTMYAIDWPMVLINQNEFTVDSGFLHSHSRWFTESQPIQVINDTLYKYKQLYGKSYLQEMYVKTTLNDSIFEILKVYEVNYPELAGTWFLIHEEILSGGDGSEWEYKLEFSHTIPDSIKISKEQFIDGIARNMLYLMATDGKKREYYFNYSWRWKYLYLTPGKWYQGEDPGIHFERRKTNH